MSFFFCRFSIQNYEAYIDLLRNFVKFECIYLCSARLDNETVFYLSGVNNRRMTIVKDP